MVWKAMAILNLGLEKAWLHLLGLLEDGHYEVERRGDGI